MKWFLYLFAYMLLALPCLPCSATEACCAEETNHAAASQDQHHQTDDAHQDHDKKCSCCSSFACNTCHSMIAFPGIAIINHRLPLRSTINHCYKADKLSQFSSPIWQPPQL
jgi:hypothetical protein